MIGPEPVNWAIAAMLLVVAGLTARDRGNPRRHTSAAFWGLAGAGFVYASWVTAGAAPAWPLGLVVLTVVVLGSSARTLRPGTVTSTGDAAREESATRLGHRLFLPALCVPVITLVVTLAGPAVTVGGRPLVAEGSASLLGLALGAVVATVVGYLLLGAHPIGAPFQEGRRLLDLMGSMALLPLVLAVVGVLFTRAGLGDAVGQVLQAVLPDGRLVAVAAYCLTMALLTLLVGNAFAAFPIVTAALGWPLLVEIHQADPAVVFSIGMLAGFCGTLVSPMAANFTLVPAALLEMRDRYGVIRTHAPTAAIMLVANVVIMYIFAFQR